MSKLTKQEFEEILNSDPYLQPRAKINEYERRLYLREVNFCCPLCGKDLHSSKQVKHEKCYEIAHIYPNRPLYEQFEALKGLERLGKTSESFENKIALCLDCHNKQDYRTSLEDYTRLLNIKKNLLKITNARESIENYSLEDDLYIIIDKIVLLKECDFEKLNYSPVPLTKKIKKDNLLLNIKIKGYVDTYFTFIRDCLRNHDGKNGFQSEVLSSQIKTAYLKLKKENDQDLVFNQIVDWIKNKTGSSSLTACEAFVSFFVQNCEVFDEITE